MLELVGVYRVLALPDHIVKTLNKQVRGEPKNGSNLEKQNSLS